MRVAIALDIGIVGEEPVENVAPRAPLAADVDDHVAPGGAGDPQCDLEILRRIARGIELVGKQDLRRRRRHRQAEREQSSDEAAARNVQSGHVRLGTK